MKNIILIFALFLTACESSLNILPRSNKTNGSFYKNSTDANSAILACYSELSSIYGHSANGEYITGPNTYMADDAVPFLTGSADRIQAWNYTFNASNMYPSGIWTSAYKGIQFSNIAIKEISKIDMDEELKRQYIGEAKFIRALHYFNLVRCFGDIPLVTKEYKSLDSVFVGRAPKSEVYSLIESDLNYAEKNLPLDYPDNEAGRATKGAAMGLLAKVYLTEAGNDDTSSYWEKAAAKAKKVIDLNKYTLWDEYWKVYSLKNRTGKESVFEILYNENYGNNYATGYAPRSAPITPVSGYGISRVSKSLFDSYSKNDKRLFVSFLTYYIDPKTKDTVHLSIDNSDPSLAISFWKLADSTSTGSNKGEKSYPYMRYSEILLIYAEALNEVMGGPNPNAYLALNKVRFRAGIKPVNNLSRKGFRDSVLLERRREFCFEGQRWFDLARRKRLISAIRSENSFNRNAGIDQHYTLLPIPQSEIDANPELKQNPGY